MNINSLKKPAVGLLAAAMLAGGTALPATAFAAAGEDASLSITTATNQASSVSYKAYQIFTAEVDGSNMNATDIQWSSGDTTIKPAVLAFVKQATTATHASETYDKFLQDEGIITATQAAATEGADKTAADAQRDAAQNVAKYLIQEFGTTDNTTRVGATSFAKALADALNAVNATATISNDNGTYSTDALKEGYVLVVTDGDATSPENSKVSGTSPVFTTLKAGNNSITEKTSIPTVTKQVSDNGTDFGSASDATLFEDQKFKITGTVADNIASYSTYEYKMTDTLTNIELKKAGATFAEADDIKVTVTAGSTKYSNKTGEGLTAFPNDAGYAAYYDYDDVDEVYRLSVCFDNLKALDGITATSTVVVEYEGHLSSSAVTGFAAGNDNTAQVSYSNNPETQDTGETEPSSTKTYTYKLDIFKQDHISKVAVPEATFKLYDSNNTEIPVIAISGNDYRVADASETAATITSGTDGHFTISGLDQGTYTIKEVSAPSGYAADTTSSFNFIVRADTSANLTAGTGETVDGKLGGAYSGKSDYVRVTGVTATTGTVSGEIDNDAVSNLPSTGRFQGVVIAIAGVVLVAGGIFVGTRGRRKDSSED